MTSTDQRTRSVRSWGAGTSAVVRLLIALDEPVTFRLHPDGTGSGAGPSGTVHDRFRAWKEDLRDHPGG